MLLIGVISSTLDGGLCGMVQIKAREIPIWSALGMLLFGIIICGSSILIFNHMELITLHIINILAVINGLYLYRKIDVSLDSL